MIHKRSAILLIGVLLCAFVTPKLSAQPVIFEQPLSPRIANYNIDVRLDVEKKLLFGKERLTWKNVSPDVIDELQFHLYLNGFRNNQSTFMQESGGSHRNFKMDEDGWGFIKVDKIMLDSGVDLTGRIEFIHPDDDNEFDKTVFRLSLPESIPPGGSIRLDIDFTAKLPQPPFARTGAKDEYFFVGQWFPKIGVYIDGEWNCHQFHRNSEFFADFGMYNVRMTVPEDNIVGATGIEVEVTNNGDGTATHFYHAEDVHDFAWTTSPEFVEVTGSAQDVDIRVLMQPDHVNQGERYLEAAQVGVEYFQNWYGDYPFPNLTVVDPRRKASGSGGMEYPTLITAGTSYRMPDGIRLPEMVIIHEFGHNYWYHLVASNEFEEPWLDEGINSYSENKIMAAEYGLNGDMLDIFGIKLNDTHFQRASYIGRPDLDPIVKKAWEYYSNGSYAVNNYPRPALVLLTLENYLGQETMDRLMRTYFERWKFKHPKTQDFIDVANEVAGQKLDWFFDQALFTNYVLDYSVDRVITKKIKKDKGYDFTLSVEHALEEDSTENEIPEQDTVSNDSASEETTIDSLKEEDEPEMYYSLVKIRRLGEFQFPVEIKVVFENGDIVKEKWDGRDYWKKLEYIKPTKLAYATVDPDEKILLDVKFHNNSKTVETNTIGVNKLAIRWMFWMQFLMDQPEFLNLFSGLSLRL
ncbi:M1 family peptidase [candidate division KSB1 bacterium]|nr:M1 family peptidase [candidate division KSB1 bacterium]